MAFLEVVVAIFVVVAFLEGMGRGIRNFNLGREVLPDIQTNCRPSRGRTRDTNQQEGNTTTKLALCSRTRDTNEGEGNTTTELALFRITTARMEFCGVRVGVPAS